jgi:hypothetical protein
MNKDYHAAKTNKCMTEIKICLDVMCNSDIDIKIRNAKLEDLKVLMQEYEVAMSNYKAEMNKELNKIDCDFREYVVQRELIALSKAIGEIVM